MQNKRVKKTENFSFSEADDRLRDALFNHGFGDLPHPKRRLFTEFYFMLMEEQKFHNSTRLRTLREVALKHFVDSLMVLKLTSLEFPLLDVGTGPGFPGIPLKIMLEKEQIFLAEGVQKRVEFLKRVREKLHLQNLDIIGRQVNEDFHYPVQAVITRAFSNINNTLEQIKYCLKLGGKVYLMKGPNVDQEIRESKEVYGEHYRLLNDIPYELPNSPHERRLVIYEKIKNFELKEDL